MLEVRSTFYSVTNQLVAQALAPHGLLRLVSERLGFWATADGVLERGISRIRRRSRVTHAARVLRIFSDARRRE